MRLPPVLFLVQSVELVVELAHLKVGQRRVVDLAVSGSVPVAKATPLWRARSLHLGRDLGHDLATPLLASRV